MERGDGDDDEMTSFKSGGNRGEEECVPERWQNR